MKVIAIDGPAGAGKSTVAQIVAQQLGFNYLDSGAIYRALTYQAIKNKVPFTDTQRLIEMVKNTKIDFNLTPYNFHIYLNEEDVTGFLRSEQISANTDNIAKIKEIREILLQVQRAQTNSKGLVIEGRDIGSVVFPETKWKFYLDASLKERARRRWQELLPKNKDISLDEVLTSLKERDERSYQREFSPLKIPFGAVVIDTEGKTSQEVAEIILSVIVPL